MQTLINPMWTSVSTSEVSTKKLVHKDKLKEAPQHRIYALEYEEADFSVTHQKSRIRKKASRRLKTAQNMKDLSGFETLIDEIEGLLGKEHDNEASRKKRRKAIQDLLEMMREKSSVLNEAPENQDSNVICTDFGLVPWDSTQLADLAPTKPLNSQESHSDIGQVESETQALINLALSKQDLSASALQEASRKLSQLRQKITSLKKQESKWLHENTETEKDAPGNLLSAERMVLEVNSDIPLEQKAKLFKITPDAVSQLLF